MISLNRLLADTDAKHYYLLCSLFSFTYELQFFILVGNFKYFNQRDFFKQPYIYKSFIILVKT